MTRVWLAAVAVIVLELLWYRQYARFDAEFHFWLHGLIGAALGLAALTAARLLAHRRSGGSGHVRPRITPWEAAFLGHVYSALPDILFLAAGAPHDYWMDAFAFHITVHFVPAPVLTALALFLLALLGYGLAMTGRPRVSGVGVGAFAAAALVATLALASAASIPDDIQDLRANPRLAWHHADHEH